MNEDGFRAHLRGKLSPRSVTSYLSNCRRVERLVGVDLRSCDLSASGVDTIGEQLRRHHATLTAGCVSDCLSAVRSYAAYRFGSPTKVLAEPSRMAAEVVAAASAPQRSRKPSSLAPATTLPKRHAAITTAGVRELLGFHAQVIDELRDRKIIRTGNAPLGDYAEYLFALAFGWSLEGNSSAGHDAVHQGIRYQIKSRRVTPRNPSRQLGAIRRLPEKTFDVLAAVLFDETYGVSRAILIPHGIVSTRAKHVPHTNSWRVMLEDWWWQAPGVRDVTAALKAAEQID